MNAPSGITLSNSLTTDLICVGETLIDFIGTQIEAPISETKDYHRYLGGSPTNVAMNMARLGMNVAMISSVGDDGFGDYMLSRFEEAGIDTQYVYRAPQTPSTVIFINNTSGMPEFIAYRGADKEIFPNQIPETLLNSCKIYHTTCFALSAEPARETILSAAECAAQQGVKLSIDINYSEKIWPDRVQATEAIARYCKHGPLVKISQDDVDRLLGPGLSHQEVFEYLHGLGAQTICFTLGKDGAKLSVQGQDVIQLSALKVEKIMDATGAGDAFWSGFLYGHIKGQKPENCLSTALQMAAIKLQNVGRIPDYADVISDILND
jgi:fructokinase